MTKCELDRVVRRYAQLVDLVLMGGTSTASDRAELPRLGQILNDARGLFWLSALNERIWRNEL
jgi:hypothetical protein